MVDRHIKLARRVGEQVEAAARGEAAPDEGDKTQTWRALRKHRRG